MQYATVALHQSGFTRGGAGVGVPATEELAAGTALGTVAALAEAMGAVAVTGGAVADEAAVACARPASFGAAPLSPAGVCEGGGLSQPTWSARPAAMAVASV